MTGEIILQQGFEDKLRGSAAALYDDAFGAKLGIAIPDAELRKEVLERGMDPAYSFAAISGDQLVGIAGFKTGQGSFTGGISLSLLKETLGTAAVLRAAPVLALFQRRRVPGQLLMDGIAVSPAMRGCGIGTQLLNRLIEYARSEGYRSIRLDVIDTNPAARRLYERIGFTPVRTERFGYLEWLLGFGSAVQMEYRVG